MRLDLDAIERRRVEATVQPAGDRLDRYFRVGEWVFQVLNEDMPALLRIARAAQGVLAWRSDDPHSADALARLRAAIEEGT